ncbi:hypothetical protein MNBD_ALPHA02-203 [hydrothermal vent metagenome]|uniref:Uncharacterized protein n=1 Tax=hydrothermal vent metagenome TaxID=652676 RepID=A0A3B0RHE8_9ZZZZ
MWRCIFATLIINKILIFPSVSAETRAFVSRENCRVLTEYIPSDDVTYKAGVDVRGKAVKPADLSPAMDLNLKDKISFQLILDVAKENRLGDRPIEQFANHPGLEGHVPLGQIAIKDGKVTLDGKPLGAQKQQLLNEFCLKSRKFP